MHTYESPIAVLIKGAIAGIVGTAALSAGMRKAPQMMEQLGVSPPEAPSEQTQPQEQPPPVELADRVATGVLEKEVEEDTKAKAGEVIHWSYGAAWGAVYGLFQGTFGWPTLLHGTIFGAVVGIVGSTLVPAIGLAPPPTEQPSEQNVMQFTLHVLYGLVTAITYRLLSRRHPMHERSLETMGEAVG